jgi:lysophospholipid acyltransferase (LPLAT)-like uncharacterized protein
MTETTGESARRRRSWFKRAAKQAAGTRAVQQTLGMAIAGYLKFVGLTSRLVATELPPGIDYATYDLEANPLIFATWHGQNYLLPLYRRKDHRVAQMISRHRDGEIIAAAAKRLGVSTIRGSGARDPSLMFERGAISAFFEMKRALAEGISVAVTADVPQRIARRAGMGTITLARATGAPIVPLALASSRSKNLGSWDRTTLNLPFSRTSFVAAEFIHVPEDADHEAMEGFRQRLENELNRVTARARELVAKK